MWVCAFTSNVFKSFIKTNNCNMKKLALVAMTLLMTLAATAKDIKTLVVTTQPLMHCENCENKIKDNIRFEKGIKSITTNLDDKTVVIEYDADKTNVQSIIEGFKKIKYDACEVKGDPSSQVDAETGATKK